MPLRGVALTKRRGHAKASSGPARPVAKGAAPQAARPNRPAKKDHRPRPAEKALGRRRAWPWLAVALTFPLFCFGWFFLPLHQWTIELRSTSLGWGNRCSHIRIDSGCGTLSAGSRLAAAYCCRLCLWFLGLSVDLHEYRLCKRAGVSRGPPCRTDRVRSFLARRPKCHALDKAIAGDGWMVVVLLRISPVVRSTYKTTRSA